MEINKAYETMFGPDIERILYGSIIDCQQNSSTQIRHSSMMGEYERQMDVWASTGIIFEDAHIKKMVQVFSC